MLHAYHQKLIVNWFRRSQGEVLNEFALFDKFVFLWVSFDAWGTYASNKVQSRDMIDWVKSESPLREKFLQLIETDSEFLDDVNALKNLCPINKYISKKQKKDGEWSFRIDEISIKNYNDFDNVLEVIYTTRNNFFHGHIDFEGERYRTLIELSFRILSKLFSETINGLLSSGW